MAIGRFENHPSQQAWAASGAISLELAPKPYTITRMAIVARADVTTTTATNFSDYWDRLISRLNLTGQGHTFFDFTNCRAAYHLGRFGWPLVQARRPTVIADSQTNATQQFAYIFHFGVAPTRVNPLTGHLEDNPFDLTGGIPPSERGNLSLGGAFAAAAAMGTNVTINDGDLDVYCWGVAPEPGDTPERYLPRAIPNWQMRTPTPSATSSAFATQDNVPAGDFLHSMLVLLTNGTNAPRDDAVLNSLQVYNQLEARELVKYGATFAASAADAKAAEILSQLGGHLAPLSENINVAAGVPVLTHVSDEGLIWLPMHTYTRFRGSGHPLYGADMRNVATGDLQLRYGVADATGVTMDVVYRKYKLNMAHPANVGA